MKTLYDKLGFLLWDGMGDDFDKYHRICEALEATHELGAITAEEALWFYDRISESLKPAITVDDWLEKQGHLKDLEGYTTEMRKQQIQAFRHRWLKHLCEQYELQSTFDKVAKHLLKQRSRAEDKEGCAYRGKEGKMCAVGCLIADAHYRPALEGRNIESELIQAALKDSGINVTRDMRFMLEDLQACHDYSEVSMWPQALRRIANHFKLSTEVLK